MNRPLLIVLTPVRNEAWILSAFLKATSLWADYIIIADQMSTDGSRDIYKRFEKVIVVDNTNAVMHQAQARKLLFDEAQKIQGDKILFALDADEFLSGNINKTKEWQAVLNSKPGDCFCLYWHNVLPDGKHYVIPNKDPFYWIYHVKNDLNGEFPDNYIHEWRLPWPTAENYNKNINCDELYFLHFGIANEKRQCNKWCFYQVSTLMKEPQKSVVSLHRMYHPAEKKKEIHEFTPTDTEFYDNNGIRLLQEIDFSDVGQYYLDVMYSCFKEKGVGYFQKLDIWNNPFVAELHLKDPRGGAMKLLHCYLRATRNYAHTFFVRAVDKCLKHIV